MKYLVIQRYLALLILVSLYFLGTAPAAFATPDRSSMGLNYQGRIVDRNGQPVAGTNVQFMVSITAPNKTCILYSERFVKDMSLSPGYFSLFLGEGQRTDTNPLSFGKIFNPDLKVLNSTQCAGGFERVPGDKLYLVMSFDPGGGFENVDPVEIMASPHSLDTFNVAGIPSSGVLRVEGATAPPLTNQNYVDLLALIAGTSNKYAQPGSGGSSGGSSGGTGSTSGITSLSGDVTTTGTGSAVATLASVGTAGTYSKVTTDEKGRVTSGSSLVAADIPSLDWSIITSGRPSTLNGYGITDGISVLSGDVTSSGAGNAVATLASVGTAGTYSKVTTDAKGRVTSGSSLVAADIPSLDWNKITTGKPTTIDGYGITDAAKTASPTFSGDVNLPGLSIWKSTGIVGVGTTVPAYKLDVAGIINASTKILSSQGAGTAGGFAFTQDASQDTGFFSPSDGVVDIYNNGGNSLRIDASGNVGVGTSSPAYKLDVNGTARVTNLVLGTVTSGSNCSPTGSLGVDSNGDLFVCK
ncbi:MAG: hypothetical protein RJB66_1479 [Pseudomonadota bacterium]|jgi:hypothetical protein